MENILRKLANENPDLVAIDFDGTLIRCNSFIRELRNVAENGKTLSLALNIIKRGAFTKSRIKFLVSELSSPLDYSSCFRHELLVLIKVALEGGHDVIVVSGASEKTLSRALDQSGTGVSFVGSTPRTNLVGTEKANYLRKRAGTGGFTYFGDSRKDLKVFELGTTNYLISNNRKLINRIVKSRLTVEVIRPDGLTCNH